MALHLDNQVESTSEHVANLVMYSREILAFFKPETPVTKISVQRVHAYRKHCAEQLVRIWIGGGGKRDRKRTATTRSSGRPAIACDRLPP